MNIRVMSVALVLMSSVALPAVAVQEFGGVEFSLPNGWAASRQEGKIILAPNETVNELTVVFVLTPASALNGKDFRSWLVTSMAASLGTRAKVLAEGQVTGQEAGPLKQLTTARAVQDNSGATRFQLFHAVSFEDRAALLMGIAASQKALDKYGPAIRSFFESVTFPGARAAHAPAAPATPVLSADRGEQVPKSGLVDGQPQGLFIGVSMLSGNPVFLLFLDNGRVLSQLPPAGLNSIHWAALVENYPNSTGQWSVTNGRLTLRWRNGGVWADAILPTPRGMKFNGKSYSAAAYVDLSQLSGIFDGAQSTAWLNAGGAGPSLTRTTTITLDGKGGVSFDSAVGGDVGNAVAYGSAASSGTVQVEGYDAVFRLKDGRIVRACVFRFPDDDSFILNGTYYIRKK
jgi:hypothetical protein